MQTQCSRACSPAHLPSTVSTTPGPLSQHRCAMSNSAAAASWKEKAICVQQDTLRGPVTLRGSGSTHLQPVQQDTLRGPVTLRGSGSTPLQPV
eukprot:364640-Chlamydomonas_euryale.AAC.12